jgi:hypothetical protein
MLKSATVSHTLSGGALMLVISMISNGAAAHPLTASANHKLTDHNSFFIFHLMQVVDKIWLWTGFA